MRGMCGNHTDMVSLGTTVWQCLYVEILHAAHAWNVCVCAMQPQLKWVRYLARVVPSDTILRSYSIFAKLTHEQKFREVGLWKWYLQ